MDLARMALYFTCGTQRTNDFCYYAPFFVIGKKARQSALSNLETGCCGRKLKIGVAEELLRDPTHLLTTKWISLLCFCISLFLQFIICCCHTYSINHFPFSIFFFHLYVLSLWYLFHLLELLLISWG